MSRIHKGNAIGRPGGAAAKPPPLPAGGRYPGGSATSSAPRPPGSHLFQPPPPSSTCWRSSSGRCGSTRKHPSSVFPLLPPGEATWVEETETDVIVPVPVSGMEGIGALVVGRPFRRPHCAFGRRSVLRSARVDGRAGGRAGAARRRGSAPSCRSLAGSGEEPGCECGPAYVEMDVPRLLAGKFRLTRRLGAGRMGAVYLARDLRLDRGHRDQDNRGHVGPAPAAAEAGSVGNGDGSAPGGRPDPRHRVLAGPPVPGRRTLSPAARSRIGCWRGRGRLRGVSPVRSPE